MKDAHSYYLDELVNNLKVINEDRIGIRWIMKDGLWLKPNTHSQYSLCDLIIAKYDGTGTPIELKGSTSKRKKAKSQINYGKIFIEEVLNLKCPYGKVVYYSRGGYKYDTYSF